MWLALSRLWELTRKDRRDARPDMVKRRRRRTSGTITWASIGLVVAVVLGIALGATLILSGSQRGHFGDTTPKVLNELEKVPLSVFNTVGINSPVIQVAGLVEAKGQPPLTVTVGNKKLPEALFVGADFCPYCAATRWGIIVALSRFGTFNGLFNMLSSATDVAPSTPTFSSLARVRRTW